VAHNGRRGSGYLCPEIGENEKRKALNSRRDVDINAKQQWSDPRKDLSLIE